jgi:hypothetical protein
MGSNWSLRRTYWCALLLLNCEMAADQCGFLEDGLGRGGGDLVEVDAGG